MLSRRVDSGIDIDERCARFLLQDVLAQHERLLPHFPSRLDDHKILVAPRSFDDAFSGSDQPADERV